MALMALMVQNVSAHQWTDKDCAVAAQDAALAAEYRDNGESEMQVKMTFLYIMHRPDPKLVYQDAEDMYILLSIVDYVYAHKDLSDLRIAPLVQAACVHGLGRA